MMRRAMVVGACVGLAVGGMSMGQGLYQRQSGVPVDEMGEPDPTQRLRGVSMLLVEPPPPPTFERNDLITIDVNELSLQQREQTMEALRQDNRNVNVQGLPDLQALLRDSTLDQALQAQIALIAYQSNAQFRSEGEYERRERMTNRVTARVIDVKPNGNLVLEARTRIQSDQEIQEYIVTGECRTADVSRDNTIESGQMFDLRIDAQHSGELRRTTRKGWLSRVFDIITPF